MDISLLIFGIIVVALLVGMLRHRGPTAVERMRAEYEGLRDDVRTVRADARARAQEQHATFLRDLDADMATYRRRQRHVGFIPGQFSPDCASPGEHTAYVDAVDEPWLHDSQPRHAHDRDDDWDPAYGHLHNPYGPFMPPGFGHVSGNLADPADVHSVRNMTELHDRACHHDF